MRKHRWLPALAALLCLVLLLSGCGGQGGDAAPETESQPEEAVLPAHWSAQGEDIRFDGEDWDSYYLSDVSLRDQDFQYTAGVHFDDMDNGLAALVFQASEDHNNCYVASVSGMTNRAELYKIENGLQIPLGKETGLDDKADYRLQVTMVDGHIAFFVDDTLVCSTGDYIVARDIGQGDLLMSEKLGLYASGSPVTFREPAHTVYEENAPVLTGLSLQAQSGSTEAEGDLLANGWYVYQPFVSSDCEAVNILAETAEGVDAVVLSADSGEPVSGPAALTPGANRFQILTSVTDETGVSRYQLSYRLIIHRRGEEPYYAESNRGLYHYSVPEGWGNDPNGLFRLGDTWHMFVQYTPGSTDWGAMHWNHAVSTDLVHWEEKGIAFYPNEYGTMFSGCAVLDEDNVSGLFDGDGGIILYITANGNGQRIIAAYSEDGDNWSYYHGTDDDGRRNGDDVLIDWRDDPLQDQAFRDPKVFKYEDTWFMVVAGGILRIYSSTDLIHWSLESTYTGQPGADENTAGLRVETECPDLMRLPIEGEDGWKWVLSYGGRRFQLGDLVRTDAGRWEFVADGEPAVMNFGNDSYAGMSYYLGSSFNGPEQDRVIVCNWMNSWDYCNRVDDLSANTRFNGVYNLNLELSLVRGRDGGLLLKQKPVEEYDGIVFPAENTALETSVSVAAGQSRELDFSGSAYKMDVTITPEAGTTVAGVLVRAGDEKGVRVEYDFSTDTLTLDRSLLGGFSSSIRFSQAVTEAGEDGSVTIHIYVDKASVEVFSGGYTAAGAAQVYPSEENDGISVFSEGGASSFDVTVTTANNMWA